MIEFNNSFFSKVYNWLSGNALLLFLLSIISSIIIGYLFVKEKKPYYSLKEVDVLSLSDIRGAGLQRVGYQVENLKRVNVLLWNQGNDYISNKDFVKTSPIRLVNLGVVKILSVKLRSCSRNELLFASVDSDSSIIEFSISESDVMERNDGASFDVYYEQKNSGDWVMEGRIKGLPEGFKYKHPSQINRDNLLMVIVPLSVLIFGVLIRVVVLLSLKKKVVFRIWELMMLSVTIILFIYIYCNDYILHWL